MSTHYVISGWSIRRILESSPGTVNISLDLGLDTTTLRRDDNDLIISETLIVPLSDLRECDSEPQDCFLIEDTGEVRKVYLYSDETRRYYKLFQPQEDVAPTIVIAGATMHTIVDSTPWEDAREKTDALPTTTGECLDTCFGLGYSAQLLERKKSARVTTCEKDPNVIRIARINPWSQRVFDNKHVDVINTDVRDLLEKSAQERFSAIFHDPPTIHQAGELYSGSLYNEFFRVLRPRGWIYHYVGEPGKKRGQDFTTGVLRRLQEAGFRRTRRCVRGVVGRRR